MHGKRSSSSAAALAIPLLLCLPNALVSASRLHDYTPSYSGGARQRGGGSLVRRDELSDLGFYNPIDYGGYMLTVSSPSLSPLRYTLSPLSGGLFLVSFPGCGYLAFRDDWSADCVRFLFTIHLRRFRVFRFLSSAMCGQYIPTDYTVGLGEPVNAILSAKSDPEILIDQETDGGLRNYFLCALSLLNFDLSSC